MIIFKYSNTPILIKTLTLGNFFCTKCKTSFEGDYKPQQRPRKSCPKCHKMVDIKKSNSVTPRTINRLKDKGETAPPATISPILASMTDNELARHRIRMILTNPATTNREVLDAVGKIVNYMDKAGTINIEEQSEKEVLNKFRSQSTQELVSLLKESSQSEL